MKSCLGLVSRQKTLPCKLFYDDLGSELFEQITELPEYYPTRTELEILQESSSEIAELLARGFRLSSWGPELPPRPARCCGRSHGSKCA